MQIVRGLLEIVWCLIAGAPCPETGEQPFLASQAAVKRGVSLLLSRCRARQGTLSGTIGIVCVEYMLLYKAIACS